MAARAGLDAITVYGGRDTNRYLLETTGCGAAFLDYDADGWPDIFLVNGTTLEGFPKGKEPTSHLYRNRRDGTFEDVTRAAGVGATGWGQAACAGDFDNDGHEDLFVSAYGQNRLYRNRGDGRLRGRHRARRARWARARAGERDAPSSTTTATGPSTSSSRTTSTSTSPPRPRPTPGCAATRACASPAGRRG